MSDAITAAAIRIGAKATEIESVEDSPAGLVITTTDGASMIDVNESNPDADGKFGLMFAVPPTDTYDGSFPVFANEPTVAKAVAGEVPDAELDDDQVPEHVADVLEWVGNDRDRAQAAYDVEVDGKQRVTLLDALAVIIDGDGV